MPAFPRRSSSGVEWEEPDVHLGSGISYFILPLLPSFHYQSQTSLAHVIIEVFSCIEKEMGLERFLLNRALLCMRSVCDHGKPKSACVFIFAWDQCGLVETALRPLYARPKVRSGLGK